MASPTKKLPIHQRAVTSMVVGGFSVVVGIASVSSIGLLNSSKFFFLGILFLILGGLSAPYALRLSAQAVKGINESNGTIGGLSTARKGRILGLIGVVLWIALVVIGIIRIARGV